MLQRLRWGGSAPRLQALFAFVTLGAILASSCDDSVLGRTIEAHNNTSQELHFARVGQGGELFMSGLTLPPRHGGVLWLVDKQDSPVFKNGCTIVDMVALDAKDHEVARRKAPLCIHDVWTVEEPTPSGS